MNRQNFFKASILSAGLSLLPLAYAADVQVLVYSEHAGTDVVYRYTLVNNGAGKMMQFTIGVRDAGDGDKATSPAPGVYSHYGQANAFGTLTRLPTGTTWVPDPDVGFSSGFDLPVPDPASVASPTQPAGWSASIGGYRSSKTYAITWTAPQPVYRGPVNVTGADAGQTLSGFTVRVPATSATGPGAVGSLEPYVTGGFMARVWLGESWIGKKEQQIFAPIEKQDTLPPTLSVSVSPATLWPPNEKLIPITVTLTVKDDYDPQPEIKLESITANETLEKDDIKEAKIGTDDRSFSLAAKREGSNKAGRIYTITYSATDASGNKATASTSVIVPHDQGGGKP
jgi:hypothetical protein